MQPLIRIDNYVNEYVDLIYKNYAKSNNIYFVNYYRLDKETSIYDEHYNDSYEDVGSLSGIKWNKILNVPIFMADPISPTVDFSEKGLNIKDSTMSTALLSPDVDLVPRTGDIFYTNINEDVSVFNVTGTSFSGNRVIDEVYTKITFATRQSSISKVDSQVNGIYMYVEPLHKIYPIDAAEWIIAILSSMDKVRNFIDNYFNNHLNVFITDSVNTVVDYELNYYYVSKIADNLPDIVSSKYIYDITFDNFSNISNSILKLLFNDNFSGGTYAKHYSSVTDNTFINPYRANLFKTINLYGISEVTDAIGEYLDLYNYSSSEKADIYTALNVLRDYTNGTVANFHTVPETTALSRLIRYYIILNSESNLDVHYPEIIKHLDENTNLLDSIYQLFVLNIMFDKLKDRNKVFS